MRIKIIGLACSLCVFVLSGCGGGGAADTGGSSSSASSSVMSSSSSSSSSVSSSSSSSSVIPTSITLVSDSGDYIGGGRSYTYSKANAEISISASGGRLSVSVVGDERWNGVFQLPSTFATLQPGSYPNLQSYSFGTTLGSIDWSGEGRGCSALGSIVIDSATYTGGTLSAIDLRFEQHCEGGVPALRGTIHWSASDNTPVPGPSVPPSGLWQPPSWAPPATGNYIYLQSDAGDYIGGGASYLYTQANAVLSVSATGRRLSVSVTGDQDWNADFAGMNSISTLQPGYYGDLRRYPFNNPAKGGLSWSGEGSGCNTLTGWFVIDSVTYSGSALSSISLRFEQHCEGGGPALHGVIRWAAGDTTVPPGPVMPIPAALWQPSPAVVPASGDYVYLQSDAGDYIGAGATYLYTPPSSPIVLNASGRSIALGVGSWSANFVGMNSLGRLETGYYPDLQRYPFNNPVKGGMDWSGNGRGCNRLSGWFVVDSVTYVGVTLTAVELRFEQHCEGGAAALRGKIRWHSGP